MTAPPTIPARPDRVQRLRARHRMVRALRGFFDERDFTEVETPALVASPGTDVHLDAFTVRVGRKQRFLHTSPEFAMKRLVAEGMGSIYQLGKAFRVDERGQIHNPEFTLLEWYSLDFDLPGLMSQTEALVTSVAETVCGSTTVRRPNGLDLNLSAPWPRLSVAEAFERYAGVRVEDVLHDENLFFELLINRVEPALDCKRPTILHSYPASMAALARLNQDNPKVADRFEVYLGGVELCNGFAELTDATEQRQRFERDTQARAQLNKPPYPIDERFLSALKSGLPACAGNALGVDRLAMLLLGQEDIASVMSFTIDDC